MSDTLRDKLGIKAGMRLYWHDMPAAIKAELEDVDEVTTIVHDPELANFFHYFVTTKHQVQLLAEKFQHLKGPHQILWVSWPHNTAKIHSDITEQDLRDALLPIGLVDTKSCSISDTYSGLKFIWRKGV
ncbi:hypothetical protein KC953_00155 [Candidatus Saccharibacteria bacterium]|nr:hypothetical protein [Candidatus Saccharibacteria bacterium]